MNTASVSRFLIYVLLFLMGVVGTIFGILKPTLFMTNPYFNGTIVCVWTLGVVMTLWVLLVLWREEGVFYQKSHRFLKILRPLANLYERNPKASQTLVDQALDRCYSSVSPDILRYMTGSLIFLGLLGTLWGLSETIVSIADVIGHLPAQDAAEGFLETLKTQLQQPLAGMGVAFSSSLLGVAGTLTLGFLMVQLDRAKEDFFEKAEIWANRLFQSENFISNKEFEPDLEVSLARWSDGIERLGRLYAGAEKRQQDLLEALVRFSEKTQGLVEGIKVQNFVMNRWSEEQTHTRQVLERVSQKMQDINFGGNEVIQSHLSQITALSQEMLRHIADPSWVNVLRQDLALQKQRFASLGEKDSEDKKTPHTVLKKPLPR